MNCSAAGIKIDLRCLEGLFTGCPILVVDVSLAAVQAGFQKRDFLYPVMAVCSFRAHG